MRILRRILPFMIVSILLLHTVHFNVYAQQNSINQTPLRAAVFINNFDDLFVSEVMKNLETIQNENKDKVEFTFFDAKGNQAFQNESIYNALNENFNLFVIRPVSNNASDIEGIFNNIEQKNIPLIVLYEKSTAIINLLKPYRNAIIINTDLVQSGVLEGKILADTWNANKETFDKNKDNIMQYIMFKGPADSNITSMRTK